MNDIRRYLYGLLLCCFIMSVGTGNMKAQENTTQQSVPSDSLAAAKLQELKKRKEAKVVYYSIKDRLAFRANMVSWVLATPSIGVQFDLFPQDYNKWTIGADVKWNPGVNQTFEPSLEYKMLDVKVEARKYFRESLTIKPGQKRMPKYWRAYYWGVYAGYTDYAIHIRNGFEGSHIGVGGTAGWEIPMITFATGALDLDLGVNAGFMFGKNTKRTENEDNTGYNYRVKGWHFTPYPIISEIRVALVYRFMSVKGKYNRSKR